MTAFDALSEWDYWESLGDEARAVNTEGVPPYDVWAVSALITGALIPSCAPAAGTILDLGCGTGRLTARIAAQMGEATICAVDISATMLWHVKRREIANVTTHMTDGRSLDGIPDPLSNTDTLDGAYAVTLFQHIPPEAQRSYMEQVGAKLRPYCRFAFTVAVGDLDEFLNHQVRPHVVVDWLKRAAMSVVDEFSDERGWHWVITEKIP